MSFEFQPKIDRILNKVNKYQTLKDNKEHDKNNDKKEPSEEENNKSADKNIDNETNKKNTKYKVQNKSKDDLSPEKGNNIDYHA